MLNLQAQGRCPALKSRMQQLPWAARCGSCPHERAAAVRRAQTNACHTTRRPHSSRRASVIAAAAAADPVSSSGVASPAPTSASHQFHFACPICLTTPFVIDGMPGGRSYPRLSCPRCARQFGADALYADLTISSGVAQTVYAPRSWQGTELFRQPLISFVYERGWRQGFASAGFPGPDAEYEIAMRALAPVLDASSSSRSGDGRATLVDASCGTGLFTRLFARSRRFGGVVALDYSESMLRQAQAYFSEDAALRESGATPIACVRADIARLPFETGSVDAIHAGAAIHCWPNPTAAMAEVARVLRPGGVFVASTFLTPFAPLGELVGDATLRPFSQNLNPMTGRNGTAFKYWEEDELRDLCAAVGLVDYERTRRRMFIMLSVRKPE